MHVVGVPITSIVQGDHVIIDNHVVWVFAAHASNEVVGETVEDGFYLVYTTSIISSVLESKRFEYTDSITKVV